MRASRTPWEFDVSDEIVVQDREELIYLLCEAAELEQAAMCSYLYAAWSLKRDPSEDVIAAELAAIERWRGTLTQVAIQEMLHLTLVNNLLAAVGAAPHLWRPAFPVRPGHFPADVVMQLTPFNLATLDHFIFLERPEGIALVDGAGFGHTAHFHRVVRPDLLAPTPQDYPSIGHLYHGVLQGLKRLAGELGEERVFVGHGQAQVDDTEFALPGLFRITSLAQAERAVEEIVLQGEGAPAHDEDSHFQRFRAIRQELEQLLAARPGFQPARPVASNPVLNAGPTTVAEAVPITEAHTSQVVDLGNSIYALMIRTLSQMLSPAPLPRALRTELAEASQVQMRAMVGVADVATRLPVGPANPGVTASLSFDLPVSTGPLVQQSAARILGERTAELAGAARRLATRSPGLGAVAERLQGLAQRFESLHDRFETPLRAAVDRLTEIRPSGGPSTSDGPAVSVALAACAGRDGAAHGPLELRFDGQRCIHARHCVLEAPQVFAANTPGVWIHPERSTVEHGVRVAQQCPSGAITYVRHDGGPQEQPPPVNLLRIRENGPYALHADIRLAGAESHRATLCRCGQSSHKPYCDGSHAGAAFVATGEPATRESEPLAQRDGPLDVHPVPDGPLQVRGNLEICSGTGRTVHRVASARLCRCGASGNKPFCDGSHARIGFRSGG